MRFGFNQLERLLAKHHQTFYISALSITKNRAAAEDAVHEALLSVSALTSDVDDLKAYVFKVIRNKAKRYVGQSARLVAADTVTEIIDSASMAHEDSVFLEQMLRHIEVLDKETQQVIIMKLFAGLTFNEIAEVMARSVNTVASWYRRGISQLQEKLNEANEK
ncbi:MAG: hypothetical protein COC19_08015 [SAR86 cluster bacterium]|uniref:RNA polymerase subunit sigma-24 n=1 Tax=SAR86 cluster bacterium TaxID=2030880 RepID=A0A2A4MFF6_9GAMM|nr:MAG: hypothetical protein COC19_08015 [SAR86 cluster bacterium]